MTRTLRRPLEAVVAGCALVLLAPVLLAVATSVRMLLGHPVLFRQERAGLGGRPFTLWKFRSMRDAVDDQGRPLPDAERLTTFGRFLRATSLDELPELVNVVRGEMAFVGPRPLPTAYLPLYSREQSRRHLVRPGITGLAQVRGRNGLPWEERFRLDCWYVDHRTLTLDLRILLLTVRAVLTGRGVQAPQHATGPLFTGSSRGDER